jgi:hypothetical protein
MVVGVRIDMRRSWPYYMTMRGLFRMISSGIVLMSAGCADFGSQNSWQAAVDRQAAQLGYRNWIVIAEASYPAQHRAGLRQVVADVEIPEALDYVLRALERTENLRPRVYLTRELRSIENDFAPGIDDMRKRINGALHGHEAAELEQQSLMTLLEDTARSFDVLVIRTRSAMPYASVFLELQPGYWDEASESRLRDRIQHERLQKVLRPAP